MRGKRFTLLNWIMLCLLLAPVLTGCQSFRRPPKPEIRQPQAVTIPATPALNGNQVIACAKLKDLNQFIERFGNWLNSLQSDMDGRAMLRSQITQKGYNLDDFRAGDNAAFFLFNPGLSFSMPPFASLIPVAPASATAEKLKENGQQASATPDNQYMIQSKNRKGLDLALSATPQLEEITKTPMTQDTMFTLNIATLMSQYGALARMQAKNLPKLLPAPPQANPELLTQQMRILGLEIDALLDLLDQTQTVSLGVNFDPAALDLNFLLKAKPATPVDHFFSTPSVATPELTRYLEPDAIFRMQYSITNMPEVTDLYIKYLGQFMGDPASPAMQQFKADLEPLKTVGSLHYAASMSQNPQGQLLYQAVLVSDNNKALMEMNDHSLMTWLNKGGVLNEFEKSCGLDISVQRDPQQRKIHRATVRRYLLQIKPTANTPEPQRAMMEKLVGNLSIEVLPIGSYVLVSMGQPVDVLVDRLYNKQSLTPIPAVQQNPAGGDYYGNINLAGMLNMMRSLMPPEVAPKLPVLPADAPPIGFVGYHQQGTAWSRIQVPNGLIASMVKSAKQAHGM